MWDNATDDRPCTRWRFGSSLERTATALGLSLSVDPSSTDRGGTERRGRRSIAMAAGGTAGHVTLALALARAYREAFPEATVTFLGGTAGMERELVPRAGFRLELLPAAPFKRQGWVGRTKALTQAVAGTVAARRLLGRMQARLVVGSGGFASVGAVLAGRLAGLGTAIIEPNVWPGLANRCLGKVAERVFLGFEDAAGSFPRERSVLTGTPVRPEILALGASGPPRQDRSRRVLVTAGSEGSRFLDAEIPALLGELAKRGLDVEARHQVGHGDVDGVRRSYREVGIEAAVACFFHDFAGCLAWADVAVTGAGASTLAEIAACGLPAVVVPVSSVAEDHQRRNAAALSRAVRWIDEARWSRQEVADGLARWLTDPEAWSAASRRVRALAHPDAAQRMVEACEELMAGRWTPSTSR